MRDINQFLFTGSRIPLDIHPVREVRVEELLGSGGFGVVCRVTDTTTGDQYALKVIRNIDAANEDVRAMRLADRVRLEAGVVIPSNYVIRALGIYEWDASTFLLLFEFFSGRSLSELIRDNVLNNRQKRDVIRQVLQGVTDAHSCNIIHRDLKPDNILVGSEGAVKVIDFGLAKFGTRRITTDGSYFGTLRYMAPELLLSGSHLADTRSDIYSLGHVFYEMATGQHFWQKEGWKGLNDFANYLKRHPTPKYAIEPDDLAADFIKNARETISDMVCIQPEGRPVTVSEVMARLELKAEPSNLSVPKRMHSPLLIVESGQTRNARTVLGLADGGTRIVGRYDIAGNDMSIGRAHVEFRRQGASYLIRDLRSKNGTLLRGQALEAERWMEVNHGDRIKLGDVFLRFAFLD